MTDSFVDTNILVYLCDPADQEKQQNVQEFIKTAMHNRTLHISNQIIAEFSRIVTEKLEKPYTADDTVAFIDGFLLWNVHAYTPRTILHALEIKEQHKLHFWDALIAATMLENRLTTIITEDEAFARVPGINVVNPFKKRRKIRTHP